MAGIRLLVGLGNPGPEYAQTRHNAGFWFIEHLADREAVAVRPEKRFFGHVGRWGDAWLLEPQTYMNRSGQSVAALASFYRVSVEEILVVHDELDLQPGAARLKRGGGHAGHNGLRDITACLGSGDFWRLRIGIGHPRSLGVDQPVADFVLHRPTAAQRSAIDDAMQRALALTPYFLRGEFSAAMQHLHTQEP